jgi:hypothetical protein
MIVTLAVALLATTSIATAGVPKLMHYQGHLTDDSGSPLDTVINMTFTIYDDSAGGTVWWTETQPGVVVSNGLFNVLLGSVNIIVDTVFKDDFRWLGIQIAADPEIVPRTRLVTVPWAYRVSTLDGATGGNVYGWIQLHSDLIVGDWMIEGAAGRLYVTNGEAPFFVADGNTEQLGIGMIDPDAQFHAEAPAENLYAGSFAGSSPSNDANVVKAEYVGTGGYDARAVYGRSAPQDHYGIGGDFEGGWLGVRGEVAATGDSDYAGVVGLVEGGSYRSVGVAGHSWNGSGSQYGVFGYALGSGSNYGVCASADYPTATVNHGLYAFAGGSETRYALYASVDTTSYDFAGYFHGNVNVTGTLGKGGGGFKIDHPLDPANKYLYHSFVESPDMKNVYDGVVVLDGRGEATVRLPDYFEAINRDFRYQLTAIGAPGPNLHISQRITDNRFRIAGGEPGMEVSWQVTGIRKDGFAEAYRIQVEVDKPARERGKYLHPEVYGLGQEYDIHYEERQQMKRQLGEMRESKGKSRRSTDVTD